MTIILETLQTQRCRQLLLLFVALLLVSLPARPAASPEMAAVMDDLVATLCAGRTAAEIDDLDQDTILAATTAEQRHVLATEHWVFEVDAPAIVSVMRDKAQQTPPFWLEEYGFEKTDMVARNEHNTYEVWQKAFPAGPVGLGINGFERHRPHYFVAVGPQDPDGTVNISNPRPDPREIYTFAPGSSIYHDWPGLVLTETPEELTGHHLLPTIRGRAREAELIGAFRETAHPASETPDMVVLTWSDDPQTTQTIQWRVASTVETDFAVYYREKDGAADAAWGATPSTSVLLDDRNIINEPRVLWHTATLEGLTPDTAYEYAIAETGTSPEEAYAAFHTAPAAKEPFSFFWMSDTHSNTESIPLLEAAWEKHPDVAFLTISGDLVGTGQQRDDWDMLFANYEDFLKHRPLVPSIGNHDAIDGLGSELYRTLMLLPDNGPEGFGRGKSFSIEYSNMLLISLDVTSSVPDQSAWLERTLRDSDAQWKVAVLHFPPYSLTHSYEEIQEEWGTLFDRYHLDIALAGHVHYYLRTHPMYGGEVVDSPAEGTVYLVSVAIPGRVRDFEQPDYVAMMDISGTHSCPAFVVEDNRLTMYAYTEDGGILDTFTIEK